MRTTHVCQTVDCLHALGLPGVGIVEKVGPGVSRVKVGDSVVMSYASCGGCNNCQVGMWAGSERGGGGGGGGPGV